MGECWVRFYREKIQKELKLAFFSTFVISILCHIYKFTNTLPNHDSVYNYYNNQNILGSGRWALSPACGISSYYDLPWINGLLSCFFIALTAAVIIALFDVKNSFLIVIIGAMLAVSPSTTQTFFYLFTADGYMIAMLLAAVAVFLSRIEEKKKHRWVISCICLCISCGIYQAYITFSLLLAVFYMTFNLLKNKYSKKDYIEWILRQIVIYSVALIAYYIIWKLCLAFTDTAITGYQGISEVGGINLAQIINGIRVSLSNVKNYFLYWNVRAHDFSLYSVLNLAFLVFMAVGLAAAFIQNKIYSKPYATILLALGMFAVIPFASIWAFVSKSLVYHSVMLQGFVVCYIFTALLYDELKFVKCKNIVCLLLLTIILNNGILANISYYFMNVCYERSYAMGVEMMSEIHDMQDEFLVERIAIVGKVTTGVQWSVYNPADNECVSGEEEHFLRGMIETNLLVDAEHALPFLRANYGMNIEHVTNAELKEITNWEEVQTMECWPSAESLKVIDGILIIKLAN